MSAENQPAPGQATDPNAATAQGNAPAEGKGTPDANKISDDAAALLKENMAMKRKLKAIDDAAAEAQKKSLEDQGKFKDLAELADKKAKSFSDRLIQSELLRKMPDLIDSELIKLFDTSALKIADDGNIEGLEEAVTAFRASKPSFFSATDSKPVVPGTPKPGSPSNSVGFATYADYEKASRADQLAWAKKNPDAFKALANAAMQPKF